MCSTRRSNPIPPYRCKMQRYPLLVYGMGTPYVILSLLAMGHINGGSSLPSAGVQHSLLYCMGQRADQPSAGLTNIPYLRVVHYWKAGYFASISYIASGYPSREYPGPMSVFWGA